MRRTLVCLGALFALVAIFYAEEDWRGQRDWNQYRKTIEARGESLDFRSYIPKPVPDDQNFCATPSLKSFFQTNNSILSNDLYARAANNISETKIIWGRAHRHFVDLVAWQMASVALQNGSLKPEQMFKTDATDLAARAAASPAVLEGMKPDAEAFAELRAASARKYSRYPVVYDLEKPWEIQLPHLMGMKMVCQRLSLEACAELAASQSEQALADVKLILSLADSVKSEPWLVSYVVRVACLQITIQPVWEGVAEHRWTDAQLQELQARFLSYDYPADMKMALKAERATVVLTVDLAKKNGAGILAGDTAQDETEKWPNPTLLNLIGRLIPSGWYHLEKLNYCTFFDAMMEGVVAPAEKTVSPQRVISNANELNLQLYSAGSASVIVHHRIIATLGVAGIINVPSKAAVAQTAANQAALACALERYRLANGQFPDKLEALTPQFIARLPNDVIGGQPYKYRRTGDGQFVLYSVGWNEKDDGGVPGERLFDEKKGDWVWDYPAK